MVAFLIQVSGRAITEHADPKYVAGAEGPRFCDEPLRHGEYFNAAPFWQREGYGRRQAWETITPGDEVLLYCTGSVDEHGACLSHLLTVESVSLDEDAGARLTFAATWELVPKIAYQQIQRELEAGRFSERMTYCGQEGFNIAQIAAQDVTRVRELADLVDPDSQSTARSEESHPDESLRDIADEYVGS